MKPAIVHLRKDPVMHRLIQKFGELDWDWETPDLFLDLVDSIISQQLSLKAASTIFSRVKTLAENDISPQSLLKLSDDQLRGCGISFSKIQYIKGVCQAVINNTLDIHNLDNLSDEEVLQALTKLKGIGRWTAEMFLMFSLKRPDVFSLGDMGLRNAVSRLYGVDKGDLKKIEEISLSWKPYRTYAARYLWKSLK